MCDKKTTSKGNVGFTDAHLRCRYVVKRPVAGFSPPPLPLDEDEKGNLGAKAPAVLDFYEHVNSGRRPCSPNFFPPLLPFFSVSFSFPCRSRILPFDVLHAELKFARANNIYGIEIFYRIFYETKFLYLEIIYVSFFLRAINARFVLLFLSLYFNAKSYSFFFFFLPKHTRGHWYLERFFERNRFISNRQPRYGKFLILRPRKFQTVLQTSFSALISLPFSKLLV